MLRIFRRFVHDQKGVTAVEYGLLVALISLAVIGGATALFTSYGEKFNFIADKLS